MTGITFEVRTEGQSTIERALGVLLDKFTDLTPLMEDLAAYLELSTVERFSTNIGPDGKPWKPSLRAQLAGGQTLVQRGLLRDSIVSASGADWAEVGTNDPRARIHQAGGTIVPKAAKALKFQLPGGLGWRFAKKVIMPARPFVGLSQEDDKQIGGIIAEYILSVVA